MCGKKAHCLECLFCCHFCRADFDASEAFKGQGMATIVIFKTDIFMVQKVTMAEHSGASCNFWVSVVKNSKVLWSKTLVQNVIVNTIFRSVKKSGELH